MDVRRLCLRARCDDLIRGMSDRALESLGNALAVYSDINSLSRIGVMRTADMEAVRRRVQDVLARNSQSREPMGLRTASLLAAASQVAPEDPAVSHVPGEVNVGNYDMSHKTTHPHMVEPSAADREAFRQGQEGRSLRGKVAAVQKAREVPLVLVKAEAMRRGVRWDTLIAADHKQARAGTDPQGGNQHAYPFYYKDGKIFRYEPG